MQIRPTNLLILTILTLCWGGIAAQTTINYPEQDCVGAIPISDTVYYQPLSYLGAGIIPGDINGGISCLQAGEVNSTWYKVQTLTSGSLCFVINALDVMDHYDWAVYKLTGHNCSEILYDTTLEVACSFQQQNWWQGPTINTQAGDLYYICLNCFSST